jgi:peroxiredoxin
MKKYIVIALATGVFSCQQKEGGKTVAVNGVVKNTTAKMVYLEENTPNGRPTTFDSADIKDGRFELKAKSKEEGLYQLRLQGKVVPFAFFINDVDKVKLTADLNNTTQPYTVENSPASQALIGFDKTMYEKGMQIFAQGGRVDSLRKASAPDSLVSASYFAMEGTANSLKEYTLQFLEKSTSPILSLYAIGSYQNTVSNLGVKGFSRTEIASVVNNATSKFPQHSGLQAVKKSLPSNKAADFTQPDINGNPVSLSQFKGKYVLVDFWASWCQPCRIDNPNVVRAYNEFKNKNFTILGVSLDQNKDAWQKAIQQDSLTWTHVSDLKFWDNAAATLYGVQGIPYNVLVNPQGEIIAENLHGEEIVQTLRQVIK